MVVVVLRRPFDDYRALRDWCDRPELTVIGRHVEHNSAALGVGARGTSKRYTDTQYR